MVYLNLPVMKTLLLGLESAKSGAAAHGSQSASEFSLFR